MTYFHWLMVPLVLIVIPTKPIQGQTTVGVACIDNGGSYGVRITFSRGADPGFSSITAVGGSGNLQTSCSTSTAAVDTPAEITDISSGPVAMFELVVTIPDTSTGVSNPACGHTKSGEYYVWTFDIAAVPGPIPGIILAAQEDVEVHCNFTSDVSKPTTNETIFNDTDVFMSSTVLPSSSPRISMILGQVGYPAIQVNPQVKLGQQAILELTLLNPKTNGIDGAVAITGHSCRFCDTFNCDTRVVYFIDSDGCPANGILSDDFGFFKYTIPTITPGTRVWSSTFNIPRFKGTNQQQLFITCKVDYCFAVNKDKCNNLCEWSRSGTRRKRSIPTISGITAAYMVIVTGKSNLAANTNRSFQMDSATEEPIVLDDTCVTKAVFIVVLSIFATLAFASMITTTLVWRKVPRK